MPNMPFPHIGRAQAAIKYVDMLMSKSLPFLIIAGRMEADFHDKAPPASIPR
jgi:hypothetical protein